MKRDFHSDSFFLKIAVKGWLLLLLLLAPVASAQVYKWVDDNGRVHYSETPPAGTKPSEVKPPAAQPQQRPAQDLQSQEIDFRRRQVEQRQIEEREAVEDANRRSRCDRAKEILAIAEHARRLYKVEKGERVFLSDDEQRAAVARRREAVSRYCR